MSTDDSVPSFQLSIEDYAYRVASSSPTPGGGSVSGMTGAFAAALAGMVCALTLKGKLSDEVRAELATAERQLADRRRSLLRLAVSDEAAFAGFRAAAKMPRKTDDEIRTSQAAMQQALDAAARAPLAIAAECRAVLEQLPAIAAHGSRHALSDASASAILAEASLRSALLNVRVNVRMMTDVKLASHLTAAADQLQTEGESLASQTYAMIETR